MPQRQRIIGKVKGHFDIDTVSNLCYKTHICVYIFSESSWIQLLIQPNPRSVTWWHHPLKSQVSVLWTLVETAVCVCRCWCFNPRPPVWECKMYPEGGFFLSREDFCRFLLRGISTLRSCVPLAFKHVTRCWTYSIVIISEIHHRSKATSNQTLLGWEKAVSRWGKQTISSLRNSSKASF